MKAWGGKERPDGPEALEPLLREACATLGLVEPGLAGGMAYVMWACWNGNDAPAVFRGIGRPIDRQALVARGVLPQARVSEEAWAGLTARGRERGPVGAYAATFRAAAELHWLRRHPQQVPFIAARLHTLAHRH